jgi:CheY-like chemotaxis protein
MDQTLALFIIALVVVALIAVLLLRSQNRNGGARAVFTLGDLFSAEVQLEPRNTQSADNAVQQAARERGEPAVEHLDATGSTVTRLARVLWVDDNPDNNLYETIALEQLGRFVTKATSTEAALRYLSALDFALIITDLGRGLDRHAGEDLIRRVRSAGRALPVIVSTTDAASRRPGLLGHGADAVVDSPHELIRAVNDHVPDATHATSADR